MQNNFSKCREWVPRGTSQHKWRWLTTLLLILTLGIGQMWADEATFTESNLNVPKTVGSITLSVPTSNGFAYSSNKLSAGGSNKYFNLTASGATISQVVIYTDNNNNRFSQSNITNCTNLSSTSVSSKKVYTCSFSTPQAEISFKNNGGGVGVTSLVVTYSATAAVCPETLTISSKDNKTAFTEGDAIELTAALAKGNGDISYQWYKGSVAPANAISGATKAKYEVASCTTADEGSYYCVASKTSCDDAVNTSGFAITVEADTKCFNMPAITSKPSNLPSVAVTGGTLSDVSVSGKTVAMDGNGLKFGGNDSRLKVTLTGASIIAGTKITVAWKGASAGSAGVGLFNENLASQVISVSGGEAAGSVSHTFTAEEAANYADEFIINRNASGSGICINAITVEDCGPAVTKHTVTLNYNDGATPDGSVKVVDGNAAVKPADPTRGKYTFLGWFVGDTDNEYVWSTAVTGDITLKAHWQDPWTLTFDADGGSAVADVTVKHNTKAEKPIDPTKDDNDFLGWFYGDPAVEFDWDANVTQDYALVAHWQPAVAKYDVEYYDGDTKIGTEPQVWATGHPTAAGINTNKPLYTFFGWYTSSTLEGDPVALNTVTPVEGLKLYGKWTKAYGINVDFEAYILANTGEKDSEDNAEAYVISQNYALSTKTKATFDANNSTNNGAYAGLKIKNSGTVLSWNVAAGKVVEFKAGVMVANGSLAINGGAATTIDGGTTGTGDNFKKHYFYSAAEALYTFTTSSGDAEVVKAITMRDPYTVTFNANGGDYVASLNGTPSVTLPSATNGTESFLGWFIGEDKIGEAGDSYTPTANVELVAHWEAISTDNTLSDLKVGGVTVDGFDPAVHTYFVVLPYGTKPENIPAISATANSAKAKQVAIEQAVLTGDPYNCYRAQANVQAEDESWGYYDVRFSFAPKDGVSIIKVATTGGTNKTVTGAYAGDGDVKLSSDTKMNDGNYIGFILDGTTLQAGDRINVHTTTAANTGGSHVIFFDNMTDKNELYETGEIGDLGDNIFTINAAMVGATTAYVYRSNADAAHKWNGYVDYIEVTRAMNPVLTAITIDGRDGEIDALDATHFSVTIPYEANLAALTVVPTIIRNAAHATTPEAVISNEGAWILGDNTYRVMDKDGDYTDYTITLGRDVLKHTVSFNTHGGSAVANELVEDGDYLAAAPADPTKEDYIFQYWSETEDGAEVDVTTVQINADKEFHAVWASDGAIKLLDGSTVNHTNFITAVTADETVEFMGNTVNYAKFSGTVSGVNGVKDLTRVIAYNATTNKTKIRIYAHNNSTSGRNILVKGLVEGADAATDLATIALGNKEDKISDWIEFNNAANRTIYIFVPSSAGDVYFTQVKVIESGETPMKQAGEAGYELNLNKGRFFGLASTDLAFEGLNARLSGDYTALNSGYAKLNATSMSFTVASDMNLVVTTNNSKTYYVTKGAAGTDNETAKTGESEFDLTAGTWYITAGNSEVQFTNIAFELPKAAKPVVADLANVDYCQGSAIDELTVVATVSDGGTKLYQWYHDGVAIDGAEAATYQPTADGEYYVIVVNTLAGHQNSDPTQSNTITVTGHAGTVISGTTGAEDWPGADVTISVTASGKNLSYAWYTCADALGMNPVAVDPAVNAAELDVTVGAADAYYKVVVSGDCGSAQEAIITVVARQTVELQDVTGNMTWDFSKANDGSAAGSNLCNDEVLANVAGIVNNSDFKSDNIKATANKFSNNKLQASMIMFHTTVDGVVTVVFSHTGNNKTDGRALVVNGTHQSALSHNQTAMTFTCYVPAGDVVLTSTTGDGGAMLNVTSVDFKVKAAPDYTRNVTNNIGTLCVDHNVLVGGAMGATFYQIASRNEQYNDKIDFEEVLPNEELKAGEPYIFKSTTGKIELYYGETEADVPVAVRGMIGSFVDAHVDITSENMSDILYIANNRLWNCEDMVGGYLDVVANRAYIVMSDVPTYADYQAAQTSNPAPRRRVTLGKDAEQTATGLENLVGGEQAQKLLINGQMYILRGEKLYDATGRLVK